MMGCSGANNDVAASEAERWIGLSSLLLAEIWNPEAISRPLHQQSLSAAAARPKSFSVMPPAS